MSAAVTRTLGLVGRAVQSRISASVRPSSLNPRLSPFQLPIGQVAGQGASRSVWYMTSQTNFNKSSHIPSTKCSCCGLHTQGDKEMADFLAEEIKTEKQNEKTKGDLPSIKGFKVNKADSAEVELQKENGNETIRVKFNVNHTVEDDFGTEDQQQESPSQMLSKPSFVVEISKSSGQSLAIQCIFPPADDMTQQGQEEQYEDEIEIQDVTFVDQNSDWADKCYTVAGSIMDGNLYDMLLTMLEERGVDAEFVDQLVEFSTSYEHKKYIDFLEQLKEFATQN